MKKDAHPKAIPAAVIEATQNRLDAQLQALLPYAATALTPEELTSMLRIGSQSLVVCGDPGPVKIPEGYSP